MSKQKVLVVLSGGLKSTVVLFKAFEADRDVHAISFRYGQLNAEAELACAISTCDMYSIPHNVLDLFSLNESFRSSVTEEGENMEVSEDTFDTTPFASYVPARNLFMLMLAASEAYRNGIYEIWTGISYPNESDHRLKTLVSLQETMSLSLEQNIVIACPFMKYTIAQIFKEVMAMGDHLSDFIIKNTHTGYTTKRDKLWPWGWGPELEKDFDPASKRRAKGWEDYMKESTNED